MATQKQQLETLLTSFGVGYKATDGHITLDEGCARVDVLGSFMYCTFAFDPDGNLSHVDIGE